MADDHFRSVTHDDLSMLADWLRDPVVAEWWPDPEHQLGLIAKDLAQPAMRQPIALRGETPLGYGSISRRTDGEGQPAWILTRLR